jgi:hypothetical protein
VTIARAALQKLSFYKRTLEQTPELQKPTTPGRAPIPRVRILWEQITATGQLLNGAYVEIDTGTGEIMSLQTLAYDD